MAAGYPRRASPPAAIRVVAVPDRRTGSDPAAQPRAVAVAAVVAVAQAVGMLGYAVLVVVQALRGDASSAGDATFLVVLVLAWGVALVVVARGLRDRHRWARAPLLLSELLLVAVGVPLVQGGGVARWAGVALVVTGAVGAVAVLSPSVTAVLDGQR
jgi:hypothetical protein